MGVLEDVLLGGTPDDQRFSKYRWGTVTQASPLRVRLDGETAALAITPETLVPVVVGNRVWCQLYGNQLVVLGVANPQPLPGTLIEVGKAEIVTNKPSATTTSTFNIATVTLPVEHCVTGALFRITGSVAGIVPDTAGAYTDLRIQVGAGANTGGTQIGASYIDHRIAGRIVGGSVEAEWTYDQTPGLTNMNIVLVGVPSSGAYCQASSSRPAYLHVDRKY